MLNVHRIITGELEENCYILNIDDNALIIDPGDEGDKIIEYVNSKKYNVLGILITHHHFDHVGALDEVKKEYKKAKVIDYKNKGNIDLGPFSFRIINTYGHTLDSVSYYFEKIIRYLLEILYLKEQLVILMMKICIQCSKV